MITDYIKKFIENNIDLIDNNDWKLFFQQWYNDAENLYPNDTAPFYDLIDTLITANVNVNMGARRAVLYDEIVFLLEQIRASYAQDDDENFISYMYIQDTLKSKLGYTKQEVDTIILDVAKELELQPSNNLGKGFTWED